MVRSHLSAVLCLALVGCSAATPAEIAGTWVVTNESRQRLLPPSQRNANATITLNENGSFVAEELPEDLLYGPPDVADRLVTGNGVWKIVSREGRQLVDLDFRLITAGQRGKVPFGTSLHVSTGLGSSTSLYYFQAGDADLGRMVTFEKK
jgi:hypothetical protein